MQFYAGLDLGKRKSQVKVIGEDRKVVEEIKVDNTPETFKRVFGKYAKRVEVACEATSNAFWVADLLEPIVHKVHVGDTKKIRWIAEARIKTDKIDAAILAELLRADLFPEICIPLFSSLSCGTSGDFETPVIWPATSVLCPRPVRQGRPSGTGG